MHRRSFLRSLAVTAGAGLVPRVGVAADDDIYDIGRFGNVRVLHITDTHAQLAPVQYREPSVNIGVGAMAGRPPHLVGRAFLDHFGIARGSRGAYAFTFLDYQEAAQRYGRMGGFAHLKTLIDRLRLEAGAGNSLVSWTDRAILAILGIRVEPSSIGRRVRRIDYALSLKTVPHCQIV